MFFFREMKSDSMTRVQGWSMKSKSFSSNIKAWHCFTYLSLTILPFSLKADGSNELFRPEVAVVVDAEGSREFQLLPNSTLFFPGECNDL